MSLYKQINGKRVEFSDIEEARLRNEWANQDRLMILKQKQEDEKAQSNLDLKSSLNKKLLGLGLTADEIEMLL